MCGMVGSCRSFFSPARGMSLALTGLAGQGPKGDPSPQVEQGYFSGMKPATGSFDMILHEIKVLSFTTGCQPLRAVRDCPEWLTHDLGSLRLFCIK
jgi:hypothetical protein